MKHPLVPLFACLLVLLIACHQPSTAAGNLAAEATANPVLVATAQADQYWRDTQATPQAYEMTLAANYEHVRSTAQATTTAQFHHAQTTATSQAFELEQARSQAQREQLVTAAPTAFLIFTGLLAVGLAAWFFWKVAPTLVNRAALVRYGQHGNPLLLIGRDGRTTITDPLRMLQAALTIDQAGEVIMPEISPNQLQTLITGGVLRTLIEQSRHAPGHPPQLPAEISHERRAGPFASITTTRHLSALRSSLDAPSRPTPGLPTAHGSPLTTHSSLPPVSWPALAAYSGPGLALGLGRQQIISLDLARTPHILLSGSSGCGKTRRALRPLIA
jgi:hypothetical protein